MTDWPDKPLIRIIRGTIGWKPIANEIARKTEKGNFAVANRLCVTGIDGDSIDAWEEVTPVPTAALKRLQDAFRGIYVIESLEPPLLEVLSYLPADKPNPLDRAVTRVKDVADTPMVDAETLPADRLSLLLDALATIQGAPRKTITLAMVTRICVDWANVEEPYCDALREIADRVESDPTRIDLVGLATLVGDVAASLDDGTNGGPRNGLLEMGSYALAWAAQIIEEEDK